MAVHDQSYRGYDGPQAPDRRRFLVVARYAVMELFALRVFPIVMVLSLVYPIGCAAFVYVANNIELLRSIGITIEGPGALGEKFFLTVLYVQGLGSAPCHARCRTAARHARPAERRPAALPRAAAVAARVLR